MERCDNCGVDSDCYTEARFDWFNWGDFLRELGCRKYPEAGGAIVFRFCAECIFDSPEREANDQRIYDLLKQHLGIFSPYGHA